MDSKLTHRPGGHQGGYVLVAVVALTTVLLATGIAFMRWSTDEAVQSRESVAAMQAYYLAQMGVVEEGFMWLRSQKEIQLPTGEVTLTSKQVDNDRAYEQVKIYSMPSLNEGAFWLEDKRFRITAVGRVRIPYFDRGSSEFKDVRRKAVLYVQIRNFADYMYLSECELTQFGERIKFWHGDTLEGWVHSNSEIAMQMDPQFYDHVTSTADRFWGVPPATPGFHGPAPEFRVSRVLVPDSADNLRIGASMSGNYYQYPGKSYRVRLEGSSAQCFRWDTGTPFDSTDRWPVQVAGKTCMFFDGPLELYGCLQGQLTIGSSNTIRLIDNVWYCDIPLRANGGYNDVPIDPRQFPDILGIVSEAEVKIANTPANGRNHSNGLGNNQPNRAYTDIVIMGAVVALGESFTFEQQNDPDSGYVYQNPPGTPATDDRGQIFLHGSVTQWRRGYVHRSNNGSTGYLKRYKYDKRFRYIKPPCFFHAQDEGGRALFNVVQWGNQLTQSRTGNQEQILPRYN